MSIVNCQTAAFAAAPFDDYSRPDSTEEGKQAAVLWLLLSIDKKLDPEKSYRLDDLFGLSQSGQEDEEDEEEREVWRETKAEVIEIMNKFLETLDGLDADERYDAVVEEIDRFAEDTDVLFLWNLLRLVYHDDDYAGNKRRVLRHLCRKLGLDNTALPVMENAAKTLAGIKKEREGLTASDRPYREVASALAALDLKEKETLDSLAELGVDMAELSGDGEGGEESYGEETIVDKVGDAVVEVINGVADGVEGILNGLTSAFTRLM
jgi:hypothetical protein